LRQALLRRTPWRRRFRVGRSNAGLGLFAIRPVKKGDFIAFYTGRLITNEAADKLWTKYMFEINNRWTLDGSTRRNIARYINHSCKPNAESDVKGHKVVITAIKNIQPGDEICYNYGRDYFDTFIKPHGCRCLACTSKPMRKRSPKSRSAKTRRSKAKARA
jgi:uncharacterized protein